MPSFRRTLTTLLATLAFAAGVGFALPAHASGSGVHGRSHHTYTGKVNVNAASETQLTALPGDRARQGQAHRRRAQAPALRPAPGPGPGQGHRPQDRAQADALPGGERAHQLPREVAFLRPGSGPARAPRRGVAARCDVPAAPRLTAPGPARSVAPFEYVCCRCP